MLMDVLTKSELARFALSTTRQISALLILHPTMQGGNAREFEKREIEKMLQMNVVEPAQSEWALHTRLFPKKMDLSNSASIIPN